MIERVLALIGLFTVIFVVVAAIDPDTNFVYCFGANAVCSLKN